ncbi:hypothetical protein SCHPADRAFT_300791 [Schizopora paradoxa]|uniref:Uncharacterized protein n=1 Tax=Schizopora paradoxa TaxID=27342 RepID=A0A0H2RYS4_9AGAM|nr:hypothetical protein SCHPADRAFT_300791 [Schizopora paradoxa]
MRASGQTLATTRPRSMRVNSLLLFLSTTTIFVASLLISALVVVVVYFGHLSSFLETADEDGDASDGDGDSSNLMNAQKGVDTCLLLDFVTFQQALNLTRGCCAMLSAYSANAFHNHLSAFLPPRYSCRCSHRLHMLLQSWMR